MADEIEDVKKEEEPSASEEIPVEEAEQEQPVSEEPVKEETPPVEGQPQYEAVDENGIPYKNRYHEQQRKFENLMDKLPEMIQQAVGQQKEQKFTIAELEAFLESDQGQNPNNRVWAKQQIRQLEEERLAKMLDERDRMREEQRTSKTKRDSSLNYVVKNYPECFKKDASGNLVGWDTQNPLANQIGIIMQDPRFQNDPEGLTAAADIAFGRMSRQSVPRTQQQVQILKEEKKNLQRQTLTEGSGQRAQTGRKKSDELRAKALKTGKVSDVLAWTKAKAAEQEK